MINEKDLNRAKTKVPRHDYKGIDFTDMSQTLNYWINSSYSAIPCDLWRGWDIVHLFIMILCFFSYETWSVVALGIV